MPTLVNCPACNRKLRVPDEMLGQKVRCPGCGGTFEANGAGPPPAATPVAEASVRPPRVEGARPASRPAAPARRNDDDDDYRPWEQPGPGVRRDCAPHRGGGVLAMGIISLVSPMLGITAPLGLILGLIGWVMGSRDLKKMEAKVMDPQGKGMTQAGWICSIIGTILSGLVTLFCVGYFAFILIFVSAMSQSFPQTMQATVKSGAPVEMKKAGEAGAGKADEDKKDDEDRPAPKRKGPKRKPAKDDDDN